LVSRDPMLLELLMLPMLLELPMLPAQRVHMKV